MSMIRQTIISAYFRIQISIYETNKNVNFKLTAKTVFFLTTNCKHFITADYKAALSLTLFPPKRINFSLFSVGFMSKIAKNSKNFLASTAVGCFPPKYMALRSLKAGHIKCHITQAYFPTQHTQA